MATAKQSVELTEDQLHLIAKALADPRRYAILRYIGSCSGHLGCSALLEASGISPATLSHHMKELDTANLVRPVRDGKFVHYTPRPEVLNAYLTRLKSDLA